MYKHYTENDGHIADTFNLKFKNKNLNISNVNLIESLNSFKENKFYESNYKSFESSITEITYQGGEYLNIYSIDSIGNIYKKQLKVYKRNNYLYLKPKYFIIPFPFLFFLYKESKGILFIDRNDNLTLIKGSSQTIWILLLTGGYNTTDIYNYEKIE
jgi:hypothetical protein